MNCWVVRVEKGTLDGRSSWGRGLERTEGWACGDGWTLRLGGPGRTLCCAMLRNVDLTSRQWRAMEASNRERDTWQVWVL